MTKRGLKIQQRKYTSLRNLTFFFMLGFLVYHLFPFPPIVWRLGIVVLSIIGLIEHKNKYKFLPAEKAMFAFIIINVVYFFFSFLWQIPEFTNFGNVLCATMPMFLFYVLAAHGVMTDRSLTIFLLLSVVGGYLYFQHAENSIIEETLSESGDITVNASTIFLVVIPLLFFVHNRGLMIGIEVVILYFIIFGAKRGNIVSMVIPTYLLFRMNMKKSSFSSKILLIVAMLGLSAFAYYTMTNSDYLMKRLDGTLEGDSSGRDDIYVAAFNQWAGSNSLHNLLFGYGTDSTRNIIGIRAHNDWLEILVDFGLLGGVSYLLFFIFLLMSAWANKRNRQAFYTLLAVLAIWFSKSLYSMGFTEVLFAYLSMVIGTVLGRNAQRKKNQIINYNKDND